MKIKEARNTKVLGEDGHGYLVEKRYCEQVYYFEL